MSSSKSSRWAAPLAIAVVFAVALSAAALGQQTAPQFKDFPASIYNGPIGRLNLSSPDVYMFRTRLRAASVQPVNFAGHYQLALWGCGADCATGAVIDALSGKATLLPSVNAHGMDTAVQNFQSIAFRSDSWLVVLNGQINDDGPIGAHFMLWNGIGLTKNYFVPFEPPSTRSSPTPPAPEEKTRNSNTAVATSPDAVATAPPSDNPSSAVDAEQKANPEKRAEKPAGGLIIGLGIISLVLMTYFLPFIVAVNRRHVNRLAIGVLNLLLGWTLLGWVAALVWACTASVEISPATKGGPARLQ
jgi:hypothetical protein